MGVNNGSALLEGEGQHTSADKKTISLLLKTIYKPRCGGGPAATAEVSPTVSTLQQIKVKLTACVDAMTGWFSQYRQLAHYFSLLCFLLIIVTLLQTFCLVQITLLFRSQSTLQESKLKDVSSALEKLNRSYQLLFSQYPALNQYCPLTNSTTGERQCGPCPAGWTPQGDKCFLFSEDRTNWISSQYRCMALGGAVATIRTEEEQVFLWKRAQSLSQGDSYWLGLRSSSGGGAGAGAGGAGGGGDGGWQWSDGSPVEKGPEFWQREPGGSADGQELCGRLTPGDNHRTSWFTSRCSNQLKRICERRQATLQ